MGKRDTQEQCIDYARSHPEARNAELAERFGVAAKTIGRWLKAAGIKRTRGRPKTGKATAKKRARTQTAELTQTPDGGEVPEQLAPRRPGYRGITTSEVRLASFLKAIRLGMFIKHACAKAGVSREIFYRWKKRAAEDPSRYPDEAAFMVAYERAEAECVEGLWEVNQGHAKKDPATARHLLALKGYRVTTEVEYSGEVKQSVTFDMSSCSREQLRAYRQGRSIDLAIDSGDD